MHQRPKINTPKQPLDRIIDGIGLIALLFSWGYVLWHFKSLPETIPTHFDASGTVDGTGSKYTLFILPGLGTLIFFGLGVLTNVPHILNYTVKITPENAAEQYERASRMLRYLKMVIQLVFAFIVFRTIGIARQPELGLGKWMLPIVLLLIMVPLALFIFTGQRSANK